MILSSRSVRLALFLIVCAAVLLAGAALGVSVRLAPSASVAQNLGSGSPTASGGSPSRSPSSAIPTRTGSPPPGGTKSPSPSSSSSPSSPPSGATPSPTSTTPYAGPWPRAAWCSAQKKAAPVADAVDIPILYAHRVEALPPGSATWSHARLETFAEYDLLPSTFEAQLDWLAAQGYTTVLPADLAAHWDHGCRLPTKPVILTFDDGSPDWISTILPALRKRGMVAEFYLTGDSIANRRLTWADVRKLAANGMGIGAHDVHHVQLAMLGRSRPPASAATMWSEVSGMRHMIQTNAGVTPDSMAYVGGGFDAALEAAVRRAGYLTARSILHGTVERPADRDALWVVRLAFWDDLVDVHTGQLKPGLPVFSAKLAGTAQ